MYIKQGYSSTCYFQTNALAMLNLMPKNVNLASGLRTSCLRLYMHNLVFQMSVTYNKTDRVTTWQL
jgi:hypothetical protein